MKKFLSTLVASGLLAACVTTPATDETIKIGYIGPLTGDAVAYGKDTLNGIMLKVEEINASGGIDGMMIELIAEDGRCNGADATSAAQKLINIDKVVAILGGQCSGESLAAIRVAEPAKVVMLSPLSSSPDLTLASDFFFRDYPSDALKSVATRTYIRDQGIKKVAIISENTDFAVAFRDALKKDLPVGTLVFDEVVGPGTKDFRTLMSRLKNTDFEVFFANGQSDAVIGAMMLQMRELGISKDAMSHEVAESATLGEIAKDAVEGMAIISVPTAGVGTPLESKFEKKYGAPQATIAFVAHAYDAMGVLAKAIDAVGTNGEAIRAWLYDMKSYDGVIGTFSFDENGDVLGIPFAHKTFVDGAIVTVNDIAVN
ncbi:MAG: ABC transporter substrate-binding protein [Candidatus Peribacteraceae bacterium]